MPGKMRRENMHILYSFSSTSDISHPFTLRGSIVLFYFLDSYSSFFPLPKSPKDTFFSNCKIFARSSLFRKYVS